MDTLYLYLLLTNMVPTPYYKDGYWYVHTGGFGRYSRLINAKILHGYIREICNNTDEIVLVNGYRCNDLLKWNEEYGVYQAAWYFKDRE